MCYAPLWIVVFCDYVSSFAFTFTSTITWNTDIRRMDNYKSRGLPALSPISLLNQISVSETLGWAERGTKLPIWSKLLNENKHWDAHSPPTCSSHTHAHTHSTEQTDSAPPPPSNKPRRKLTQTRRVMRLKLTMNRSLPLFWVWIRRIVKGQPNLPYSYWCKMKMVVHL